MTKEQWPTVKLGDLYRKTRSTDPRKNPDHEYKLFSIPAYDSAKPERVQGRDVGSTKTILESGDVLLSKIVPHIQRVWVIAEAQNAIGSSEWIVLNDNRFDPDCLRHYLFSKEFHKRFLLTVAGVGGSLSRARPSAAARIEIPLPPLEEQRRIAEILDKAVTNLDNSRKSLKALNTFLPNLFESSFNRGNRNITSIGSYLAQTQYGTGAKAGESGTFPFLRMGNITFEGQIDFSDLKFIDLDPSEFVKYTLKTGDILFNRTNSKDLVGKTAVYYGEEGSFAYAGYLVRCRANSNSTPEYISGYLNSPTGKAVLRNAAKSIVGMANINAKELQRLPIPEADPVEQRQWAEFAQEIHNLSDKLKKQVTLHHELYESLSARAFTGEL